jgi:hypothetical protein
MNVNFKYKIEAYLYTIYILQNILWENRDKAVSTQIMQTIERIRIAIENHEQDPEIVANLLTPLYTSNALEDILTEQQQLILFSLDNAIRTSDYELNDQEKWLNPLARRFETEIQLALLQNPTEMMMSSVKKISLQILDIIEQSPEAFQMLQDELDENAHCIAFGAFKNPPGINEIQALLNENKPENLTTIMFIHFKMAQAVIRQLRVEYEGIAMKAANIMDNKMYKSSYYKERGRGIFLRPPAKINTMGILVDDREFYQHGLPTSDISWIPDAKFQLPNFKSPYTKSLLNTETPYVAGPSGMTSMFMGQLLTLGDQMTINENRSYFAAVTAYMVSGGFHSLHEILSPVSYCLEEYNILPGYETIIPTEAAQIPPPSYHVFYEMIESFDQEFKDSLLNGWRKLESFFRNIHVENEPSLLTFHSLDVHLKVLKAIDTYIEDKQSKVSYIFNPDKKRGITRANNFRTLLSTAKSLLDRIIIMNAIFSSSSKGETLKIVLARELGFDGVNEAQYHYKRILDHEIKRLHIDKSNVVSVEEIISQISNDIIDPLANISNKNQVYDPEADSGSFHRICEELQTLNDKLASTFYESDLETNIEKHVEPDVETQKSTNAEKQREIKRQLLKFKEEASNDDAVNSVNFLSL